MNIMGSELDFSYSNPEHLKKYQAARKAMAEKYADLLAPAPAPLGEDAYIALLGKAIHAFCDFFDALFGEGTANKLFGPHTDFETVMDAYADFLRQAQAQALSLQQKMAAFLPDDAQP